MKHPDGIRLILENSRTLTAALLLGLVLPQIYWLAKGYAEVQDWEKALWAFYVALLCVFAYFFESHNPIFRGIIGIFKRFHFPPGEIWALVYGFAFFGLGLFFLLGLVPGQ